MKLNEVYDEYIRKCSVTVRSETVKYYKRHLKMIVSFLEENDVDTVDKITYDSIYQYIEFRKENDISNNTINKQIGALKQALNYVCKVHQLRNPLDGFATLKQDFQETKIIPEVYLDKIIDYVDELTATPLHLRHRIMIYLLIDTGIRRNELIHLRLKNIDFENNQIRLTTTKTNKNRTVYISDETKEAILEYIRVAHIKDYLMVKTGTNKLSNPANLFEVLQSIKRNLDLPDDLSVSFHKFRHTYATTCLENGADLEFVRSTLGHSTLLETQKYLHLANENKKFQHKEFGPLVKRKNKTKKSN